MKKQNLNLTEKARNGRNGMQLVYVLNCIEFCQYASDENIIFSSDHDKIKFFFDCFDSEYNCNGTKRNFPNLADRIGHYLTGLPGCFAVDYYDDEIIKLGVKWGVLKSENDHKRANFIYNFFRVLGCRIIQVANKTGYNVQSYY